MLMLNRCLTIKRKFKLKGTLAIITLIKISIFIKIYPKAKNTLISMENLTSLLPKIILTLSLTLKELKLIKLKLITMKIVLKELLKKNLIENL